MSFVTVSVKGGALGDLQTDKQNRICALRPASSAADAGLRIGDVIFKVDNGPLSTTPLDELLAAGDEVTIELERCATPMGGMPAPPPPVPPVAAAPAAAPADKKAAGGAAGAAACFPSAEAEEAPIASLAMSEIDLLASQGAAAPPAAKPARARGHARRASAPPGFDKLASAARASLGMPPSATGSAGDGPQSEKTAGGANAKEGAKPDSALQKLKGWWAERQAKQQAGSGKGAAKPMLPMPAFLEDAFSAEDSNSFEELRLTNDEEFE